MGDEAREGTGQGAAARRDAGRWPGRRRAARRQDSDGGSFWRELPFILVAALLLSLLIKTFVVQAFFIPSSSMERTLLVGDRVFVSKLSTRFGEIERGDVVVFHDPDAWLPPRLVPEGTGGLAETVRGGLEYVGLVPAVTGDDLIKRVIGTEGDRVRCEDSTVVVNGVPLDEPYVHPGDAACEDDTFDVTVPEGHLWVMGDHRAVSEDSRAHQGGELGGFVPEDEVIGRAFVVVWPIGRFSGIGRPDTFDAVPAP